MGTHGSRPMIGTNAIDRLTDAVHQLRTDFGQRELAIDAEMEPIIDESVAFYEPETGAEAARSLYRFPTINLGILEGGTAINTVPRIGVYLGRYQADRGCRDRGGPSVDPELSRRHGRHRTHGPLVGQRHVRTAGDAAG